MDLRIKELIKRLRFLGYCSFEIKFILREAESDGRQGIDLIGVLEKYERLGLHYLNCYSK